MYICDKYTRPLLQPSRVHKMKCRKISITSSATLWWGMAFSILLEFLYWFSVKDKNKTTSI